MKLTHPLRSAIIIATLASAAASATAWEMNGIKTVRLHGRDGGTVALGTVEFKPQGERTAFVLKIDHDKMKDFFLSMREFKCLEGGSEVQCHVPYPYKQPGTVSKTDMAWLEHSLMFFYKLPTDFGAKLWNGLYYPLRLTERGLVGSPQAIDLNAIAAPPADFSRPPYGLAERSDLPASARWFGKLTIE